MRAWFLIWVTVVAAAGAADYVVNWSPSPSAGDPNQEPITYRIYKAENGATNYWHTDEPSYRFRVPTGGVVRIWVTTLSGTHTESAASEVLTYQPGTPPNAPEKLRLRK